MQTANLDLPRKIFFARHQSHFDTLTIWAALPLKHRRCLRPVAALDYWGTTALRRWFATRVMNAILIDRNARPTRGKHPLTPLLNALDAGYSILIFPEGTRVSNQYPSAFKSGIYHLARKVPLTHCLPLQLDNLGRILPKGEILPLPIIARLELMSPITLKEGESKAEFLARCADAATRPL